MHELLERHLQSLGLSADTPPQSTAQWSALLDAISHSLTEADAVRTRRSEELAAQTNSLEEEVSRRREIEQQLRHAAHHDSLTMLPNRVLCMARISECLSRLRRDGGIGFAVLYLDLDNFKAVNDRLGHEAGDEVLMEIARRLADGIREHDAIGTGIKCTPGRLGGDEFILILERVQDESQALAIAERMRLIVARPLIVNDQHIEVGVSVGVAIAHTGRESTEDLLREADTAMYHAKHCGKGRVAVFDDVMHSAVIARTGLETQLRDALAGGEFELHYQPIVSLTTAQLTGFEALLRWRHPDGSLILPGAFIGIAEEAGIIHSLGRWAIEQAAAQARLWNEIPSLEGPVAVHVNVSHKQVQCGELADEVRSAIDGSGIDPRLICLEMAESAFLANMEDSAKIVNRLRDLGVCICLDDFGTGHSSLSCLHRLEIDSLKIDRSFIKVVENNRRYCSVVDGIVHLARVLQMRVICEGIETTGQLAQMLALGCEQGQGFLFSKAISAQAATALVSRRSAWRVGA